MSSPTSFRGNHPFTQSMIDKYQEQEVTFNALLGKCGPTLERAAAAKMELQVRSNFAMGLPKDRAYEQGAAKAHEIIGLDLLGIQLSDGSSSSEIPLQTQIVRLTDVITDIIGQIDRQFENDANVRDISSQKVKEGTTEHDVVLALREKYLYMLRWLDIYKQTLDTKKRDIQTLLGNFGFTGVFSTAWHTFGIRIPGEVPKRAESVADKILTQAGLTFTTSADLQTQLLARRVSVSDTSKIELLVEARQQAEAKQKEAEARAAQLEAKLKELQEGKGVPQSTHDEAIGKLQLEIENLRATLATTVTQEDHERAVKEFEDQITALKEELQTAKAELEAQKDFISPQEYEARLKAINDKDDKAAALTEALAALVLAEED